MLIGSVFVSYQWPESVYGTIISLIFFMVAFYIIIVWRVTKPLENTYMTRSLAESIKTISWKWMMCTKPYQIVENEKKFLDDLKFLLSMSLYKKNLLNDYSATELNKTITEEMRQVRKMPFEQRKQCYLEQRIMEQLKWYVSKSEYNKKMGDRWFWCSFLLNSAAIVILFLRIGGLYYTLHLEVIVTSTSAALAWFQSKRFNELSTAYTQTAYEIGLIISEADTITTEEALSNYVLSSENAISREHTQWYARKV
jgi:hypothetical protein